MASNLDCVGLGPTDDLGLGDLVQRLMVTAVRLGARDGVETVRLEDPGGARLVLELAEGSVRDLTPSYAGDPGASVAQLRALGEDLAAVDVVDEHGEQLTAAAVDLEQGRWLTGGGDAVAGPFAASVVALGVGMGLFADADAYAASDASLLTPADSGPSEPPAEYVEKGWAWPPRMGAESFISYGLFATDGDPDAYAHLAGTVLRAETRTTEVTGQRFHVVRLRTAGFETDCCLAESEHPECPAVGSVVAGTAYLVASIDALAGS